MNRSLLALVFFPILTCGAENWEFQSILTDFHAEGSAVGDLNGDGVPDLAYGPFWFAGPDFKKQGRFAKGDPFVPDKGYSDNFLAFIHDINGDGHADILVFGFPGKEARLYLNPGPGQLGGLWEMRVIAESVGHESPTLTDLVPGGLPEIVCSRGKSYGFYEAGEDPTALWKWHAISAEGDAVQPFGHGMGVGDLNGDGRLDVVEKQHWYEQPADPRSGLWKKHRWALVAYGGGGGQILVHDVDGDGDADLITSLNAHAYGLAWFEQISPGKFKRHDIMGASSTDNPHGVAFSQLHALALADIDKDGRLDFVTGKRWMAHNGKDPGAFQSAVLYGFQNTKTADGIEFVPHLIHHDSGVGVQLNAADLNGDGRIDIVSSSKKGLSVHRQTGASEVSGVERWQVPGNRPQGDYGAGLSPAEALKRMDAPDGFEVDLIAAEPDVVQPIAMCFDARGRLWVIEGKTYPQRAADGEGKDRVLIFEDSNGDGKFDQRKVFVENVNLASGIAVGFGGVFIGAAPNFLFYPDADGDDVPDGDPEVLLDGWGWQDTHETLNSFTWGPDGWLYGCHGVFTHSNVGRPGTPEAERQRINAGVWRFHPVRKEFEVFAWGTSNPWGLDFDEHGNWFMTACVIPHFYHVIQGGRYQRQAGQHFDPYLFDDLKTIADHAHYVGHIRDHAFWGENYDTRPAAPSDTSALGGGHAHCGLALYLADVFPPAFRGDAFFHNLHGHRIVRERIERDGSGHIVRHHPDFVLSNNHDFIGVTVLLGPDGALYYSDWVDPQTCHHRDVEIWDRSNGRIYRVRHGETRTTRIDLPAMDDEMLVETLGHANAFHARQAQRLLQERSAAGTSDVDRLRRLLTDFEAKHQDRETMRLRSFWAAHVCGLLKESDLLERLSDPSEPIRGWAVQFLGEGKKALSVGSLKAIEDLAAQELSQITRRFLASLLQRLPEEQRWGLAATLMSRSKDQHDRNLPLLTWYGIEPLVGADTERAFTMADQTDWKLVREFVTRRAAATAEGREALMDRLAGSKDASQFISRAEEIQNTLGALPSVGRPAKWDRARATGEALQVNQPRIKLLIAQMGARFGDADFFPEWRAVARDVKEDDRARREALELLLAGRDPELGALARELLGHPPLDGTLVKALRQSPDIATAEALVTRLETFAPSLRNEAINLLASKPEMARVLLRAVDQKKITSSVISPVLLDQFERFKDAEIDTLIAEHWTRGGGVELEGLAEAMAKWKRKLNDGQMEKADASRGRLIYQAVCGNCHQLFGEGIALGPDLTGSNRADLRYVLENVLAPNAVVGKDYQLQVFTLQDGSVVSGIVREETAEFLKVAMAGGATVDVRISELNKREVLAQSLMSPGLFDALPIDSVADLVKYLASPQQVPLSIENKLSPASP